MVQISTAMNTCSYIHVVVFIYEIVYVMDLNDPYLHVGLYTFSAVQMLTQLKGDNDILSE